MKGTKSKNGTEGKCPNCNSNAIASNYFTGEIYCLECGLVLG